jgi:hypothetical protein
MMMAYESTPAEIRNDRELLAEFPPKELAGICDGQMVWRSAETIAMSREGGGFGHQGQIGHRRSLMKRMTRRNQFYHAAGAEVDRTREMRLSGMTRGAHGNANYGQG